MRLRIRYLASTLSLSAAVASTSIATATDTYTQMAAERRAPAESAPAAGQSTTSTAPKESARTTVAASDALAHVVLNEFQHDPIVGHHGVRVSVEDGAVRLTGTVPTIIARERATHLAEAVRGVTAVRNDMVVVPTVEISADDLESTILQALVSNPATEAFQIRLEAEPDGQVLLTGEVDSWAEKELAGRLAKSVKGVAGVRNAIEVDYQATRTDEELETEIARLLRWDAYIDHGDIEVEVERGAVRLSGVVTSAAEKRRAEAIAFTAGTKSVDASALTVKEGSAKQRSSDETAFDEETVAAAVADEEIAAAVRTFVSREPLADADQLEIEARSGVVTLRGDVESLKAKRSLVTRASNVAGVREVRDRLTVRTSDEASEEARISQQVIAALAADPLTEAYQISVGVNDGIVRLSGHVDSWFERGTADDLAANVRGVREVDNDLIVERSNERVTYDPYVDAWSIYEYDWYTPSPPTVRKQDAVIAGEIEQQLAWSPFVDRDEVSVTVENGVATLKGRVDSIAERDAAMENAFEGGAASVVNELVIGS